MEGGNYTELITSACIAAGFLAALVLAIYAIRRARRSRQRQIEQAGEDRPLPSAKKSHAALRPEDVVPDAENEATGPSTRRISGEFPPPEETKREAKAATGQTAPTPAPLPEEAPSAPSKTAKASPPVEKPSADHRPVQAKRQGVADLAPGLARTRAGWISRLGELIAGKKEIDPTLVEEIERVLLTSDIGVRTSQKMLEEIRSSLSRRELESPDAVWGYLRKRSSDFLRIDAQAVNFAAAKPFVILVVGVNGSGKTTTIGKLASKLKAEGRTVLLAAGDTFRAAATEQLEIWGERVGAPVVRGKEGGDPSSVIFDSIKRATAEGMDIVIADTAGRLHTKSDLMEELQKVRRVVGKALAGAPHETWLVIDATSGQNAIAQAQIFAQAMAVTGIVLTKLDGTAKGGVILGISDQLGIPVRYIGVGERVEDLRPFDADDFVDALFTGVQTSSEIAS